MPEGRGADILSLSFTCCPCNEHASAPKPHRLAQAAATVLSETKLTANDAATMDQCSW